VRGGPPGVEEEPLVVLEEVVDVPGDLRDMRVQPDQRPGRPLPARVRGRRVVTGKRGKAPQSRPDTARPGVAVAGSGQGPAIELRDRAAWITEASAVLDIAWATSWNDEANRLLAPLLHITPRTSPTRLITADPATGLTRAAIDHVITWAKSLDAP
jgi:hypothetical protein